MKITLIVIGVLVAIAAVVAGIGMSLPAEHVAKTRTSFKTAPTELYSAITDVKAFPSWRSDVKKVELLPLKDGKAAWREDGSNGKITYELVDAIAPGRVKVRIADEKLPFGGTWSYEINRTRTGSELTIIEDGVVRNPIFRFMSRYVFGQYSTQETYLRDLGKKFKESVTPVRI